MQAGAPSGAGPAPLLLLAVLLLLVVLVCTAVRVSRACRLMPPVTRRMVMRVMVVLPLRLCPRLLLLLYRALWWWQQPANACRKDAWGSGASGPAP